MVQLNLVLDFLKISFKITASFLNIFLYQKVYSSSLCGVLDTCSNWIFNNPDTASSFYRNYLAGYNHSTGLQMLSFSSPVFVKKGSMLGVESTNIAIDTTDGSQISDYYLTTTFIGTTSFVKIYLPGNYRFYVRAVINQTYYMDRINISKTFDSTYGLYEISADLIKSSYSSKLKRAFNVTSCKKLININKKIS